MTESNSRFTRRRFLGGVAGTVAAAGVWSALPPGMAESFAQPRRSGSLKDVKHVVILMQENRSFDHYYGTMSGVRGFGDRSALTQPDGNDIFHQPDTGRTDGGYLLPYRLDTTKYDGQDTEGVDHGWASQHDAVAGGANNNWVAAKETERTMGYFTEDDIPFHRALADSFTICDHYHCSVRGETTPNRLYLFSGTIDADGQNGGPANHNPADYTPVYSWTTYPERLQDANVSWKVYANKEVGDDTKNSPFVGDYGDNPLWLFHKYHDDYNSDLSSRASVTGTWLPDSGQGKDVNHVLTDFIADCKSGALPEVSWIVAPYGYCEHPEARPVDGSAYAQGVLNALWANPDLWESTVVLLNYDENDGFFDHVPPPTAPAGTAGEFAEDLPIGLGARVPMTVISPWSRGGWVNSQVFDHTSVIRFLEQWTGVAEPNISAWRRSICGDLLSCFDFDTSDTSVPALPDTAKLRQQADETEPGLPAPVPPATGEQVAPKQTPGTRPARPLPYAPAVSFGLSSDGKTLTTTFTNSGSADVQLWAYRFDGRTDGPWSYDVAAGKQAADNWDATLNGAQIGISVHGPNRFRWDYTANTSGAAAGLEVSGSYTSDNKLRLTMNNSGTATATFTIKANNYRTDGPWTYTVAPGASTSDDWNPLGNGQGWYDLSVTADLDGKFLRRFSGHIENGAPSITG